MNKWVKVENSLLSDYLFEGMRNLISDKYKGKLPDSWTRCNVHSFRQIDKRYLEICWECRCPHTGDIKMGNCVLDSEWEFYL